MHSQKVLALSIVDDVESIILPSAEIQQITIDQALNFNAEGYGHLEFKAWKRRYLLEMADDQSSSDFEKECTLKFSVKEELLRHDVTRAYHILDTLGWVETIYQHITAKIDEDEAMLINAYGLEFGEVTPDNLMKVKMDGTVLYEGNSVRAGYINPAGLALHAAVHEARDDAKVVIHCHHSALSAIGVIEEGLDESLMDIGYKELTGSVVYHEFDTLSLAINKTALAEELSNGSNVVILRNHGILTVGETVEDAFNRLFYTIQAAETQIKMMKFPKLQKLQNEKGYMATNEYVNAWKRFNNYINLY